jgi:WhiB family redox-sensing transcriptional regulator
VPSHAEEPFYAYLMAPEAPDPELLVGSMLSRPNWQLEGSCRYADPNLFFPVRGASILPAVAICSSCNVRPECLRYGLADSTLTGVWGGTSERGRKLIRRQAAAGGASRDLAS